MSSQVIDVATEEPVRPVAVPATVRRRQWIWVLRTAARVGRTRVGLAIVGLVLVVAIFGPLLAPHSPTEFVASPNSAPSSAALLGADALGRDVLSRFLHGGPTVIWLAATATALGVLLGTVCGLYAAYVGGWFDDVLMRAVDVLLAFPQIVLALLVVSALGPHLWLIVLTVGITNAPRAARVMRTTAQEIGERDFVKGAEAVGERRSRIVFGEILPNASGQLLVQIGQLMTYSIGIVAALSFLGFGLQPPAADWGLMINENRLSILIQPWGVLLPVIAIALLTVGVNLVTDGVARAAAGIERGGDR